MSLDALVEADLLMENLERRGNQIPEKLQKLVTEVSFIVQGHVQDATPKITHNLESSIRRENVGAFSSKIYPDEGIAPYAYYVLKGTRPHIIDIYPVNAQALFWPGADHPVKHVQVHHPGTEGNPFMDIGLENSQTDIENELEMFKSWLTGDNDDY